MTIDAGSFDGAGASYQGTRMAPTRAYHRKWQEVFDLIEQQENAGTGGPRLTFSQRLKTQSIPGFFFGPLYYFYLKMWRKGLLIIALLPIISLTQTIVGGGRFLDLLIPVLCMTYVKRDYYRFCVQGETVWPILRFSRSIWTDAALVTGLVIVCSIGIAAFDRTRDGGTQTAQRSTSSQEHASDGSLPELSNNDLRYIEEQGGQSGIDCSMARQIMPQVFLMRQQGTPIDDAKDYLHNKGDGFRTSLFMSKTVEDLYRNPTKMKSMISTGLWSKACVAFIRGY